MHVCVCVFVCVSLVQWCAVKQLKKFGIDDLATLIDSACLILFQHFTLDRLSTAQLVVRCQMAPSMSSMHVSAVQTLLFAQP